MRPVLLWLSVTVLLSGGAACAQSFEETFGLHPVKVTLEKVILQTIARSLDVRIEQLNWQVADQQARVAMGKFDPTFSLSSTYAESDKPQNAIDYVSTGGVLVPLTEPNLFYQQSVQSQFALGGALPTGTEYKLFATAGEYRNDLNIQTPPSIYYPEYGASVGVTLLQPLLRDFGPSAAMAAVRVERKNTQIADLKWEELLQNTVAAVIIDYFDLVFAVESLEVKRGVVAFAQTLVTESQKRLELGVLSAADVQEAQVAVSVAREDVITSLGLVIERQNEMRRQMVDQLSDDFAIVYVPEEGLPRMNVDFVREQLLRTALQRRPDHRATLHEAEKQAVIVKYMRNQLLPRMDLQATLASNGLSGSRLSAYERAGDRQGYEVQVGLQVSIPLGNTAAKARKEAALARQEQAILSIARSEISIAAVLDTLISRAKTQRAKMESTRESAKLAERLLETEQKRLESGLSRSFDVLKARQSLADSRTRELAAQADFNKVATQLSASVGMLLDRYGIQIDRSSGKSKVSTAALEVNR